MIPELPNPSELKPFPTKIAMRFKGHTAKVRSLSISSDAKFLATGDEDGKVFIFEARTGRVRKRYPFDSKVSSLAWNPVSAEEQHPILAVVSGNRVIILKPSKLYPKTG